MASRYEVEVTIQSARDLKNVNWRNGPVKAYAVVWIDPAAKCTTKADVDGDTNPTWDEKLIVPLGDRPLDDAVLYIDVVHAGSSDGVKPLIGSARLPLREVLDEAGMGGKCIRSLKLKRPSGRPHGTIEVKVKVAPRSDPRYGDPYAPPYGAGTRDPYGGGAGTRDPYGGGGYGQPYAAPPPSGYPYSAPPYGAAPPQPAYGYGAAPPAYGAAPPAYGQAGYGAPPPAYGQTEYAAAQPAYGQSSYEKDSYGAAPSSGYNQGGYGSTPVVAEKKKSKFGMGTGLAVGAAAGLLGGLALYEGAEFVEDKIADKAAEKVEEDEYVEKVDDGDYYDDDY